MIGNILIVCSGKRCLDKEHILGCIYRGDEWDCTVCEVVRQRIFRLCPWNSWGGKKKEKLNGEDRVEGKCYWCRQAELKGQQN